MGEKWYTASAPRARTSAAKRFSASRNLSSGSAVSKEMAGCA